MIHARACDALDTTATEAHCSSATCVTAMCGLVMLTVTQCSTATCVACIGGGVAVAQCSAAIWVSCALVPNGPVGGVNAPPYIAVPVTTRTSSRRPGKYRLLLLSLPTTQAW